MRALGPGEAVPHMNWPRVARPGKRQQPFWVVCGQVWGLGLLLCHWPLLLFI